MVVTRKHYNKPQLKSMLIGAPNEVVIAGRGTGKTTGILAPKTSNCYFGTMPRSTGVNINATYTQAFTRTLKELVRGWISLGFIYEHHFLVGRRPPEAWKKKWKWQGPYAPPMDYKYFISWNNGAVCQIVSQDRVGSSNGISIDWIFGDEAKLLDDERLKTELYPANRGIIPEFAGNPYHHGITLTTDMPVGTAGRWLLEKVNDMDREVINQIWELQTVRFQVKHVLLPKATTKGKQEIGKQLEIIDQEIMSLRHGLLYYHEASTLENIDALGLEYIKTQIRDTSRFQFDTQILNIRPLRLEDGFYPDFNETYHGYFSEEASYFDNSEIDPLNPVVDCRKDKDLDPNLPLHMGGDYGRRIHPFALLQVHPKEIRVLNGIHSMYPFKLKEAVEEIVRYYKPHKRKLMYYWYDHTAVGDQHESRICDDVMKGLRKGGWIVKPMYIGQQPSHAKRYLMWGNLLKENETYSRPIRFNRENCDKMILSINQAGAEQKKDGYGKDKRSEADPLFPADESTHYTDAVDTPVYGILESGLAFSNSSGGGGGSILIG